MFSPLLAIPILLSVISPGTSHRIAVSTSSPRQNAEVNKATVEAKITLLRRERIRSHWGRMITRIEAVIARLETLIERMERRIAIIETGDEDIDTASAKADVVQAKTLLAEAKADFEAAKDEIEDVIESPDPKAAFGQVIETIREIKSNLVEVHRLLVHAIGDIKGLRVGTPTVTPTP